MPRWEKTFERVLDRHRRDDGSRWSGASIERATGGEVSRFYVYGIQRGTNNNPSFDKIAAISRGTGVPLEAWLEEPGKHEES